MGFRLDWYQRRTPDVGVPCDPERMALHPELTARTTEQAAYEAKLVAACRRLETHAGTCGWLDGMAALLRWATGEEQVSPLRRIAAPADPAQMLQELQAAQVVLFKDDVPEAEAAFATGVSAAARWVSGDPEVGVYLLPRPKVTS
jgi:hypothetical protein